MKQPLFECTVLMAQSIGSSSHKQELPIHQVHPTIQRTMQGTLCMQCGSKNEWRNLFGRTGVSVQRVLLRCTIVCTRRARETIQVFEPHLNTALPHVQRLLVPRSRQLTAGRVGSLRGSTTNGEHRQKRHLFESCILLLHVVCGLLYVVVVFCCCCMLLLLCFVVCCML